MRKSTKVTCSKRYVEVFHFAIQPLSPLSITTMRFFAVFYILCGLVAAIDPYKVLGIGKDADEKTIKSAYRRLSKQYHPDKNLAADAHDKFIEIGEAYEILNDPQKKKNYDQFGNPDGQGGGQGGFDFGDMFNQFFQGGAGGGQPRRRRGADTQVSLRLSLKDFFRGRDFGFDVEMNNICTKCTGSGSADGKRHTCTKCGGRGVITVRRQMGPMVQQFQTHCDACGGKGSTIANMCKTCGGGGTERKVRHYDIYIPAGTERNHVHVLEGEGDQNPEWDAGNLNVVFLEDSLNNWGYRRIGDNLYRTEVLSAREAFEGDWIREIPLFDEDTVTIKRGKGQVVIDGQVDVIKGHGMPLLNDDGEFGTLFVQYRVVPVGNGGGGSGNDEL